MQASCMHQRLDCQSSCRCSWHCFFGGEHKGDVLVVQAMDAPKQGCHKGELYYKCTYVEGIQLWTEFWPARFWTFNLQHVYLWIKQQHSFPKACLCTGNVTGPDTIRHHFSQHTMWLPMPKEPDMAVPKRNVDGWDGSGAPDTTPITTKGKLILCYWSASCASI